jgi:plastocyanin
MVFLPGDLWIDAGDTVVWTPGTGEEHLVTFLQAGQKATQIDPTDPAVYTTSYAQGGAHQTGVDAYSSEILSTPPDAYANPQPYQLTFDKTGDFMYYCQLHAMMQGHIHVRPAGTP